MPVSRLDTGTTPAKHATPCEGLDNRARFYISAANPNGLNEQGDMGAAAWMDTQGLERLRLIGFSINPTIAGSKPGLHLKFYDGPSRGGANHTGSPCCR